MPSERFRCSQMRWTVNAAESKLALCCCVLSGRDEGYWECRAEEAGAIFATNLIYAISILTN